MRQFLLISPFQVISAAELVAERGWDANEIDAVMLPTTPSNTRQAVETARRLSLPVRLLDGETEAPRGKLARARRWFLLRRLVDRLSASDSLIIGDPSTAILADVLQRAACEQRWVLDDGVVSIRFLDQVIAPGRSDWKGFPGSFVDQFLLRRPDWGRVDWFTIFADFYPHHPRIHANRLRALRRRQLQQHADGPAVFLGSPLASAGMFDPGCYAQFCRQAAERLRHLRPGKELVYLQHRSESSKEAAAYDHFDRIEESDGPVELRWLDGTRPLPTVVGSMFSTALFSLATILDGETQVVSFWPPSGSDVRLAWRDPTGLLPIFRRAAEQGLLQLEFLENESTNA